ncbi:MAG TPA: ComEC/Rec2 family competence protein [Bdellovibrionales bacterium]|nr:ComEC/Rec2 family competence protein [Bdellovibrionales bacterium]
MTPTGSYKPYYDAIVCGAPLPDRLAAPFQVTGLIHLLVVSGTHLIFLSELLRRAGIQRFEIHAAILSGFVVMTGGQAPALRALAALILGALSRWLGLSWSHLDVTLASGMLLWALFPELITKLSFLLSWAAALSLSLTGGGGLKRHIAMFAFLYPVLAPLAPPHPASIFFNWLFAPVVGSFLFPASLAATLVPPLATASNLLWSVTETVLTTLAMGLTPLPPADPPPRAALWVYLWSLHLGAHGYRVWAARRGDAA